MPETVNVAVPVPSYSDGFRRGYDAGHGEVREEQLASVFERDADHVDTMLIAVRAIQHGLGHICESEARIPIRIAAELARALEAATEGCRQIALDHRQEAKRLQEDRRS